MQATQILIQAASRQPHRVATIFAERHRTWREIAGRVPRLAGALRALGARPHDRVATLAMNSDRYVDTTEKQIEWRIH